jgi:hypothetical protein
MKQYGNSGIFNLAASSASPVMVRNLFFANNGLDYQRFKDSTALKSSLNPDPYR